MRQYGIRREMTPPDAVKNVPCSGNDRIFVFPSRIGFCFAGTFFLRTGAAYTVDISALELIGCAIL